MTAPARHDDLAPETIESALNALDPNVSREEWWRIAAALKSELGEAGFDMFDRWSRNGDGYDAKDCRDTWKSTKDGGGVNVGSLIWRAQQNGWRFDDDRPKLDTAAIEKRRADREAERKAAEAETRRIQGEAAQLGALEALNTEVANAGVQRHSSACCWWINRKDVECTCGAITDVDILRAQLLSEPLPEPKAHAQFKLMRK